MTLRLLNGDCLQLMKTLPDKSIDCFICDLPYGQLTGGGGKEKKKRKSLQSMENGLLGGCAWDVKIDLKEFWKQVERLQKDDHTPVLHFCNTKFGYDLISSNPKWFRYDLVWNKDRGVSFLLANKMPMKSHEMVYVFSKKGPYYNRIDEKTDKGDWTVNRVNYKAPSKQYGVGRGEGIQTGGAGGDRCVLSVINIYKVGTLRGLHPTEKPKELYKWLLERYCVNGGTVLDPTAGSFNSVEVARDLGLNGIGIEMDKKFYDTAVARLQI
jgi:DNA modification methylase